MRSKQSGGAQNRRINRGKRVGGRGGEGERPSVGRHPQSGAAFHVVTTATESVRRRES